MKQYERLDEVFKKYTDLLLNMKTFSCYNLKRSDKPLIVSKTMWKRFHIRRSMVNIKEVAKLSKTSIATVSRAINNSGYVKQETRDRIQEAINTLDYKPLERSNEVKRTRTIGLIVPNMENPFFGKMADYLSKAANSFGYNILLINIKGFEENKDEFLNGLMSGGEDGLIYASSYKSLEVAALAERNNIPIVVLDREIKNARITSVGVNNNFGAYIATEHLIKLGHKNIAYIGAEKNMEISAKRKEGYKSALEAYNIPASEKYICYGDYTMQSGFECIRDLYGNNPEITAVIAVNDLMAIGVINFFQKSGINVPGDISVVGFDNINLSESITPPLTTVEYPIARMSDVVVDLLLKQIRNKENSEEMITLFPKLIVRDSTGPANR